jgi:hypothetical protein
MSTEMKGQVVAVTGANAGIGRATARALAAMGAKVLACGRDRGRLDEALASIRAEVPGAAVTALVADLSSVNEVRGLAGQIRAQTDRLDVLINNAGVGVDRRQETVDGFELTFAVNHLAPFVLTTELLDLLEASAPARVITVSSANHVGAKTLDLEDLQSREALRLAGCLRPLEALQRALHPRARAQAGRDRGHGQLPAPRRDRHGVRCRRRPSRDSTRGCSACSSGFCPAPSAAPAPRSSWHPLRGSPRRRAGTSLTASRRSRAGWRPTTSSPPRSGARANAWRSRCLGRRPAETQQSVSPRGSVSRSRLNVSEP